MQLIKDMFYWPGMSSDTSHFVMKTCSCVQKKRSPKLKKAPLQCTSTNAALELVDLDFLHLDLCRRECEYLLIITYHFSGFTQAYPTANEKYKTAPERLYSEFMLRFGLPDNILYDQGGEFGKELAKLCGFKRIKDNTLLHPNQPKSRRHKPNYYFYIANIARTP